ncbi:RND family efflux transporter MFP subunit [Halospina denitrificans]|uniref:RND family efflux transporter MFP subunit n=1 Tax=Halospina denitrificans TaxID=332522 RepID=A0A4R7K1M7_9GAMM|nr:efflux RND transporter periplasmic adaptor subunit [Halospina denitrificans]TDT43917.1 RND family efflux transporter MFP subunit [Halospina denitrificans]
MITDWRSAFSVLAVCVAVMVLAGCGDHSDDHGHDHGDAGHGEEAHEPDSEGRPSAVVTRYNDDTELFLEYPALVAGEGSRFAVHLSRLEQYDPVTEGELTVTLEKNGEVVAGFRVSRPTRDGLYTPTIEPRDAGTFDLKIAWKNDERSSEHIIPDVRVYADPESVPEQLGDSPEGEIQFTKEQQWRVPFHTTTVGERRLRESVPATGYLRALPGRDRRVHAPVPGRVQPPEDGWPEPGQRVEADTVVARLVPRLGVGTDVGSLRLAVEEAEGQVRLARRERRRLEGLFEKEAIPQRRVIEARVEARVAEAGLKAARQRLEAYQQGDEPVEAAAMVPVMAGTAGTVAEVMTGPGSYLDEGEPMLRVVDRQRLRLEARVSESEALEQPAGAWYTPAGSDQRFTVDPDNGARLVSAGELIDASSRTRSVIFELSNEANHRVGTAAKVRVWNGDSKRALAVPVSAVQRESGETVVYLANGGETFERRVVNLGIRAGDYVAVRRGLEDGDRVVVDGSYLVRLAASGGGDAGHGHTH